MLTRFAGGLSRARCEAAVLASGHGDFLVRESSRADKFVLVVNDNGTYAYSVLT